MRRRNAFTLLEVLLAMSIAVMVLGAVYAFVGYQLRQAQAGRDVIERATLARSILNRIDTDLRAVVALNDPGRYRLQPDVSGDTSSSPTASASTSSTAGASSPSAPSSASSPSSPGSASSSSTSSSNSGTSSTSTLTPIDLPRGVVGSDTELNIFVTRLPSEVFGNDSSDPTLLTSDLRRITYWMADGDAGGLCRNEARLVTTDEALDTTTLPSGDVAQYLYAPEVKSVEFGYFDGTAWQTSWDSTTLGPDQTTPIGSPRAISVKIELKHGSTTKTYRHVIAIACADGTPLNLNPEGGTTAP